MGKGFDQRDAIAQLRQFHGRAIDEARAFVNVVVDKAFRQRQQIGHEFPLKWFSRLWREPFHGDSLSVEML